MNYDILVLQHAAVETPGLIAEIAAARGLNLHTVHCYAGDAIPENLHPAAGLLVMGGPMGVYETGRYAHLKAEMRLIEKALHAGRPVLGICLGSQLLAAALGARVIKGPAKEIGWKPVYLRPDAAQDPLLQGVSSPLKVLHWHGDVFDLPSGSIPLAYSDMTQNQAFRHAGNAYGFLFHLEMTEPMIRDMARVFSAEMEETGLDHETLLHDTRTCLAAAHQTGRRVFNTWINLVTDEILENF